MLHFTIKNHSQFTKKLIPMKNNELQELKPVYIHEKSYSANDEISLIDLAMVLVNRKKLVYLVFTAFIVLGIAAALLITKKYTYSTSIEIGSQIVNDAISPFESTQTLLAKLQHSYIPQVLNEQSKLELDSKKRHQIKASSPKGSVILVLEIKGTKDQSELIIQLLQSITQKATEDHSRIYDSVKQNITSQLAVAKDELNALKKNDNKETEITSQQTLIEKYSSQLANLRNTREMLPPMQSPEPTGISRKLIVIISAFSGLFIAVLAAFFAEFASKVRKEIVNRES